MSDFRLRTEDLKDDELLALFVRTKRDDAVVAHLKSASPVILEGSRGTGKSFLLRVAKAELLASFATDLVLPVYVSFSKSSLIHTADPQQFQHWMLARLCAEIIRAMHKKGFLVHNPRGLSILAAGTVPSSAERTRIEEIAELYEDSYRSPGSTVDASGIPTVDQFKNVIEDVCDELGLSRIAIFFDEAAHVFRPEQQRQFFTLFRDLRSPFVSCNAAVYPGVTSYGPTFQAAHDATILEINRSVLDNDYRESMREIVAKQADATLLARIEQHRENFFALAYAVSGNPRLLLKTVGKAMTMSSKDVTTVLKEFYRTDVWSEHSGLADTYAGHKALIDWGRNFIENVVIPETRAKNEQWTKEGKSDSTCFFWLHRDAPEAVKEALRLLAYTGIVVKMDSGYVGSRGQNGTRFAVNVGCLNAPDAFPIPAITKMAAQLTPKRFTEFGASATAFESLTKAIGEFHEPDMSEILQRQLGKNIDVLEMTDFQKTRLHELHFHTVGDALRASEADFQQAHYIGPTRSRKMMNSVVASVLEYLSG